MRSITLSEILNELKAGSVCKMLEFKLKFELKFFANIQPFILQTESVSNLFEASDRVIALERFFQKQVGNRRTF